MRLCTESPAPLVPRSPEHLFPAPLTSSPLIAPDHSSDAGRKTQGEITGDVLFSAQKPSQSFLRRYTGYVEQFDTLLDILTVREMLLYTAEMKRPLEEPLSEKEKVVDHYIDVLGLDVCKDTRIGNPLNRYTPVQRWLSCSHRLDH